MVGVFVVGCSLDSCISAMSTFCSCMSSWSSVVELWIPFTLIWSIFSDWFFGFLLVLIWLFVLGVVVCWFWFLFLLFVNVLILLWYLTCRDVVGCPVLIDGLMVFARLEVGC